MIVYKLLRVMRDNTLASPFINKRRRLEVGVWLEAEDHPTKGFKHRPGWHCVPQPHMPNIKNMDGRAWFRVRIDDFYEVDRHDYQGGLCYVAQRMMILHENFGSEISERD